MKYLSFAMLILLTSACATKQVMKQSIVSKYQLTEAELDQIQYYNSSDIILTRLAESKNGKQTEKGTLTLDASTGVQQVVIKQGTRGKIVKHLPNNKIAVAFEADESKYLVFGPAQRGDVYELMATEWKDDKGKVQYGEHTYSTNNGANKCALVFKLKRQYEVRSEVSIAKGNKVK